MDHTALAMRTFGERLGSEAGRAALGDDVVGRVLRAATSAATAKRLPDDEPTMIAAAVALLEVPAHRDLARALLSALDRKAVERAMGGPKRKAKKDVTPAPPLPKKIDFLRNLDRIAATLKAGKYRTKWPVPVQREKPDDKAAAGLEKIVGGPLPMAMRALYAAFRVIDLREHPEALVDTYTLDEELGRHDPLVVLPVKLVTTQAKQQSSVRKQQAAALREPFRLGLTVVAGGKGDPEGDYDGMVTWHAVLPDPGFDVRVVDERGEAAWLVDLLRQYVLAGGFLGRVAQATKAKLAAGLEPF